MERFDAIVIGQGYAGLTAAKLAAERGLRVLNIEQNCMGGLIMNINELDPRPEGADHCGAELAGDLATANMDAGVEMPFASVTSIERTGDNAWQVSTAGEAYEARHVVIASGAKLRKLGIPGEAEFFGKGVSECADCDGPMYRNMETVIVGGGDSAFQEAAALAQFATKVTIMMRGAGPRARQELVDRVAADPKIVQVFETELTSIEGAPGKGVESVRMRHRGTGSESSLPTSGVFVFVGLEPNTAFAPAEVERDNDGALKARENCATSAKGLWVIGAARHGFGGLLTHADADVRCAVEAISQALAKTK